MNKTKVTPTQVKHVSHLAHIPVSDQEATKLASAFEETLVIVDQLQQLDTKNTSTTHQVTGLENVWREDEINQPRMLSQQDALKNAKKTFQGYFVVPRIIE